MSAERQRCCGGWRSTRSGTDRCRPNCRKRGSCCTRRRPAAYPCGTSPSGTGCAWALSTSRCSVRHPDGPTATSAASSTTAPSSSASRTRAGAPCSPVTPSRRPNVTCSRARRRSRRSCWPCRTTGARPATPRTCSPPALRSRSSGWDATTVTGIRIPTCSRCSKSSAPRCGGPTSRAPSASRSLSGCRSRSRHRSRRSAAGGRAWLARVRTRCVLQPTGDARARRWEAGRR